MDILDVILDENNCDDITMVNDVGKIINLKQVAVIPYNDKIYCILKPTDHINGVAEDEAIVFYVDEDIATRILRVETDEVTAMNVFLQYYDLIEENILAQRRKRS